MLSRQLDLYEPVISRATLDRAGTVQEIADVVLFLCSSRATFVQGAAYVVDGGYTIH
jgi:NAD(P)-dependent dehydrogenase (short-subunit alcohol dehydrogenase family)